MKYASDERPDVDRRGVEAAQPVARSVEAMEGANLPSQRFCDEYLSAMGDQLSCLAKALATRYTIERELGHGGMATVYLAHDPKYDRAVAIKVLRPDLAAALGAERFLREIAIVARLHHPHILPLYDSNEAEGFLYYVMPCVEGESLRARLERERQLPLEDALQIARQVADALSYAHSHDVLHRDIKPENILLEAGHAIVCDFGVARAITAAGGVSLSEPGVVVGTAAYMSPEQSTGGPIDGRTDIYGLGCVLYEMLAGAPPFTGPTIQSILARHSLDAVPPLRTARPTVPESVEHAILRALAKVPADRFGTAAQFAEALVAPAAPRPWGAGAGGSSSIAVLPFVNMSPERENEYFSDGMTEELINALTRVPGLRIASRTSAFAFKGKQEDVRSIGRQLNVQTVLEGSVRRAGKKLRVTAQLVDVADGYHLWSETYDREMQDVFAVQEDISRSIVERLEVRLRGGRQPLVKRATEDVDAYHLYLKGRYFSNRRTEEGLKKSIAFFEQALERDPHYPLPHAGLADTYLILGNYDHLRPGEAYPRATSAAQRALELDEQLAEAHASLGGVAAVYEWDWQRAERAFRRAIELSPGYATAHHWYAIDCLTPLGRQAEAAAALELARELDPLSLAVGASVGLRRYFARDYDGAVEEYRKTLEMDPSFGIAHLFLGQAYLGQLRHEQAVKEFRQAVALTEESAEAVAGLAHALAVAGDTGETRGLLGQLLRRAEHGYVSPHLIALIHVGLDDMTQAFAWLERACAERCYKLVYLNVDPKFEPLRADPQFGGLLRRIGLVQRQTGTGRGRSAPGSR